MKDLQNDRFSVDLAIVSISMQVLFLGLRRI